MQRYIIPACYFPTTVLFIDDSEEFLINFTLQLSDQLAFRIYDSPYNALEAITDNQKKFHDMLTQYQVAKPNGAETQETENSSNYNLGLLHSEIYNPHRFSEISVVIVDYAMPGMNGLEFCKELENTHIKRILLTGQADEKTAVNAFNEGIIHRFIQKSEVELAQTVLDNIAQLQRQYFQNMSEMICHLLSITPSHSLQDKKFAEFFNQLIEEHNIVEYYLVDSSGSFLLLDNTGQTHYLIVKNKHDLQTLYDIAKSKNAPEDVLEKIKSGEKIFSTCQVHQQQDWQHYQLFDAQKLIGELDQYYYAYAPACDLLELDHANILSYKSYLQQSTQ